MPRKTHKNPKAKGSQFERKVCKLLSLWVSGGKRSDVFWRSAMSGGRSTVKGLKTQAGDVTSVDPLGTGLLEAFVIECKCYKDLQLHRLVLGTGGLFDTVWECLNREAERVSRQPMLIAKQFAQPELMGVDSIGVACLGLAVSATAVFRDLDLHVYRLSDVLGQTYVELR